MQEAGLVLAPLVWTHMRDFKQYIVLGGPRELSYDDMLERGARVRAACEWLGATYIKLAQFLTTRPDYVPPAYMEELEKLQDEVPPADYEDIAAVIEDELGPVDEVFDDFEREAISGASIAQVHRATIDGEEVAVKIQRPGLEGIIEADLAMLSILTPIGEAFMRLIGQRSHAVTMGGIIGMFRENIRHEMDFHREKEIMDEIRGHVEDDGIDDKVVIPETWDDYCTGRVITMSYEPGVKIKDAERLEAMDIDLHDAVDWITEIYLRMPFEYETFQADPHYGNIAVNEDGQVIVYDYGIAMSVGEFEEEHEAEELLDAFRAMFVGIGMQDPDMVINAMIDMEVIDPTDPDMDLEAIREMGDIMVRDVAGGGGITHEDIEKAEDMMLAEMGDHPIRLHQDIVLPFRTTVGVEGLCANVLPEYDFSAKLSEFFVEGGIDLPDRFFEEVVGEYEEEREARRKKRNRKRNALRVGVAGGSAALVGGAVATAGAVSLLAVPTYLVAALGGLWLYNSFQERNPVGPTQYATRYRMDQWDEEDHGEPPAAAVGNGDGAAETAAEEGDEDLADQYLE